MSEGLSIYDESKVQPYDGKVYGTMIFDCELTADQIMCLCNHLRGKTPEPAPKLGFLKRVWRRILSKISRRK